MASKPAAVPSSRLLDDATFAAIIHTAGVILANRVQVRDDDCDVPPAEAMRALCTASRMKADAAIIAAIQGKERRAVSDDDVTVYLQTAARLAAMGLEEFGGGGARAAGRTARLG